MFKFLLAFLAVFGCIHATDYEMCVTVNKEKGTYTIDPSGCVYTPPMPNPVHIPVKK